MDEPEGEKETLHRLLVFGESTALPNPDSHSLAFVDRRMDRHDSGGIYCHWIGQE
jgi:hypothetical protein